MTHKRILVLLLYTCIYVYIYIHIIEVLIVVLGSLICKATKEVRIHTC